MMIPTEAQEQTALFQWAEYMANRWPELRTMHHIANGGSRNAIEAHNLRLQGVKAGIPDIFLPCARHGYNGLYVEMKRQKGGRLSAAQEIMIQRLREQGYQVAVCKGFDAAKNTITEYMT